MTMRKAIVAGAVALAASASVSAQRNAVDASFTATGTRCTDVTWSEETLRTYPNIEDACQEVMRRDGRYYVRFEGDVRRVADRGRQVTVDFQGGSSLTLTPPEGFSVELDGRTTPVRDLRPGDELTFYVPEDRLMAHFFDEEQPVAASPAREVPISAPDELLAQNTQEPSARLPSTASILPKAAGAGLILLVLGAVLTLRRRLDDSS